MSEYKLLYCNTMACWIVRIGGGPRRSNQVAVAVEHRIYSFGGCQCFRDSSTEQIIDIFGVHVLNTVDYRWNFVPAVPFEPNPQEELIDGAGVPYQAYGELPTLRVGHTVVAYQGLIYMWGGYCPVTDTACSKMYCFNPEEETWTVIPSANQTPQPRSKHTAVVYNDVMFIYAGIENDIVNDDTNLCNDVWAYCFKTRHWYSIIVHGDIPQERFEHTACVIDGKMYVYGGIDSNHDALHLDVLNLEQGHWERPSTSGRKPLGIRSTCSWVHNNLMYIFGGCQLHDEHYTSTLHRFDPRTLTWHRMRPFGLEGPMERERHCGVVVGDCAYVFSGLASIFSFTEHLDFGCLIEMSDLSVLSHNWTLKDLAALAVIRYKLDSTNSDQLPLELKIHLHMMVKDNNIL
ncbi:unnamed protein product [Litomosoides sigmodontis]|uniref:Kelch domain-containing protein n=1 Tax=Litomosoides sigmodontis TaxID=42156 RepID=A0A3P6TBF4_LITSI|nr:unnamed protein product [Litomosoides sigmodontis]